MLNSQFLSHMLSQGIKEGEVVVYGVGVPVRKQPLIQQELQSKVKGKVHVVFVDESSNFREEHFEAYKQIRAKLKADQDEK